MCSRTESAGPSSVSISYIAKFLAAYILRNRKDFTTLVAIPAIKISFYLRISCLFSLFSTVKTIELNLVFRLCLFTLNEIHLSSPYITIGLKVLISSFRSLEPPSPRKGRVGTL